MRLFLGIDIPSQLKHFLCLAYAPIQLNSKGWELPHDYHLTLLYIGETDQQAEIIQRMVKIKQDSFKLKLRGLEFFPRRILYQAFDDSPALQGLKTKVENEFSEWVNPNAKPFKAHMTIKRFQRYEYDQLATLIADHPFSSEEFIVEKLSLFKSEKNELGQKYHILYSQKLSHPL